MIELDRYSNQKEDVVFEFLLESFSTYQNRDGVIYVEGIEFRVIEKVNLNIFLCCVLNYCLRYRVNRKTRPYGLSNSRAQSL
jgi:hypothetical protein